MNYENKFTEEILYQIKKAIFLSGVERENLIIHMDCNMYNLLISYSDAIVYKNNCFDEKITLFGVDVEIEKNRNRNGYWRLEKVLSKSY